MRKRKLAMSITFFCVILLFSTIVSAGMEVSVSVAYPYYTSEYMGVPQSPLLKATAGTERYYTWASFEKAQMRSRVHNFYGQLEIMGAGIGFRKAPFFFELGYYYPVAEAEGEWTHGDRFYESFAESMSVRLLSDDWRRWPNYSYEIKGHVGGAVGMEQVIGHLGNYEFRAFASYRFLKLEEEMLGYEPNTLPADGYWIIRDVRDASMAMVGIGVVW